MPYKFFAMVLFLPLCIFARADAPHAEVRKHITRTYSPAPGQSLFVGNEYGNIKVSTWRKNEIRIDIDIVVKAGSSAESKHMAERVAIVDENTGHQISCRTVIASPDSSRSAQKNTQDASFNITYTILVPDGLVLSLRNSFGNILLDDYSGRITITNNFGDFTARRLSAIDSLTIEQGNVSISHLSEGTLVAKAFESIRIDTVSGNVHCRFSLGRLLNIGLLNGAYLFSLESDNVAVVNIHCPKNFSPDASVNAILSRVSNPPSLPLTEDRGTPPRIADTTTATSPEQKKFKAFGLIARKNRHYHTPATGGAPRLEIKVAFSQLNFR